MATEDGLSLTQVREQWEESSRLIDEARRRLELLADAREANELAAASLRQASESVAGLASDAGVALTSGADALAQATSSLEAITTVMQSSEVGALSRSLGDFAARLEGLSTQFTEVLDRTSAIEASAASISVRLTTVEDRQLGLSSTLDSILAAIDTSAEMQRQRDDAVARLRQMYDSLPGRTQGKVQGLLPQ